MQNDIVERFGSVFSLDHAVVRVGKVEVIVGVFPQLGPKKSDELKARVRYMAIERFMANRWDDRKLASHFKRNDSRHRCPANVFIRNEYRS
jgi:hypothetical protein